MPHSPHLPQQLPGWGYGYLPPAARPQVRHTSHVRLVAVFMVALAAFVGAALLVAVLRTPDKTDTACPPTCPRPPLGAPVVTGITYQGAGFSFVYPEADAVFGAAKNVDGGRLLEVQVGDGGAVLLTGGTADGRTAEQYATSYVRAKFADAERAYVVPNSFVGYTAGYGEIDDVYVQSTSGEYEHDRLIVLSAVKNGVGVLAVGLGPYHPWDAHFTNGHPSGTAALVGRVMSPMVNSFRWTGDPPR